jgi:adenylosuccinate synthase
VAPVKIDKVIGIAKAYTTRVGEGPFPTEFSQEFSNVIRTKGHEFGATTGRPRRCGWFDAVIAKESVMINGISELAIMKMDVLDGLKTIKIATSYLYKGKKFRTFPRDLEILAGAKPVYLEVPGWPERLHKPSSYRQLHPNAKKYLSLLKDLLGARITMVSVGSARKDTIFVK